MPLVPFDVVVTDPLGRARVNVPMRVYERSTQSDAVIRDAEVGGSSVSPSNIVTDVEGRFPGLWIEDGIYELEIVGDDIGAPQPWVASRTHLQGTGDANWDTAMLNENAARGGKLVLRGEFATEGSIIFDKWGSGILADGKSSTALSAIIRADHDQGPVVRYKARHHEFRGVLISSTTARYEEAGPGNGENLNVGILEASDEGGLSQFNIYESFRINQQPSAAMVMVGRWKGDRISNFIIAFCDGHGIVADDGAMLGWATVNRVGGLTIVDGNIQQLGGNTLRLGQTGATVYRCLVDNCDMHHAATDPDVRMSEDVVWINAQNTTISRNGLGGPGDEDDASVGGILLRGQNNRIIENRFLRMTGHCIDQHGSGSEGNYVEGIYLVDNPAVQPLLNQMVRVSAGTPPEVVVYDMVGAKRVLKKGLPGGISRSPGEWLLRGTNITGAALSGEDTGITIPDDGVVALEFDVTGVTATGIIAINGSNEGAGGGVLRFRVGDTPHARSLGLDGVSLGTGGLPSGASGGVDGTLNVHADSPSPRLFVKNRAGSQRTYQFGLLALNDGARYSGLNLGAGYDELVLSTAPDLFWALNTLNGATDLSGNGHHGTGGGGIVIGGSAVTPNLFTTTTNFDGAATPDSDHIIASGYNPFDSAGVQSFLAWAYRDASGVTHTMISANATGTDRSIFGFTSVDGNVTFDTQPSVGDTDTWAGTPALAGGWHPLIWVVDLPNDQVTLHVDGVSQGAKTHTDDYTASIGDFMLGALGSPLSTPYDGKMARVAVWDRALTATEIAELSDV